MSSPFALNLRGLLLVSVLLCSVALRAESQTAAPGYIQGKVLLPSGSPLSESVKVLLETLRGTKSIAFTDYQGQFQFMKLAPAIYQVFVEADKLQFEEATLQVEVFPNAPSFVTIILKEKNPARGGKGNVVSTMELGGEVPSKARKEFELASAAMNRGQNELAAQHLRNAIALYPNYLMAHNDLGTELLAQGKLEEAEAEFRAAAKIDGKAFNPVLNLGIVLVYQQRFPEAVATLKDALAAQPNSASARLHLGMAFIGQNELDSAEKELKIAHQIGGSNYAIALFRLGEVHMNRGDRQKAIEMFEAYLRDAPDGANAVQARKLIAVLR